MYLMLLIYLKMVKVVNFMLCIYYYKLKYNFLEDFIYLFLDRGEGKEK